MIDLPKCLRPPVKTINKPHYEDLIEVRGSEFFKDRHYEGWSYIPILWTLFYEGIHSSIFSQIRGWKGRQAKLFNKRYNQLVNTQSDKLFTIVQHAHGIGFIPEYVKQNKSILTFSCGGEGDIALPLLSLTTRKKISCGRRYLASFKGAMSFNGIAYPYRQAIQKCFTGDRYKIIDTVEGKDDYDYDELMCSSHFAFCPRGSGRTSFRLKEALQLGAIPIYLFDDYPWLPFQELINWREFSIVSHYKNLDDVKWLIENMNEYEIEQMRCKGRAIYKEYFSVDYSLNYVASTMSNLKQLTVAEIRDFYNNIYDKNNNLY